MAVTFLCNAAVGCTSGKLPARLGYYYQFNVNHLASGRGSATWMQIYMPPSSMCCPRAEATPAHGQATRVSHLLALSLGAGEGYRAMVPAAGSKKRSNPEDNEAPDDSSPSPPLAGEAKVRG